MKCGPALSFSRADRTCSTRAIKTCSVIAPKDGPCSPESGWRVGDHRREARFGGQLAVDAGTPGELAHGRALLDELHLELEQDSGLDGLAELRPFDRHEIDKLARSGEAERLHGENARRLGE